MDVKILIQQYGSKAAAYAAVRNELLLFPTNELMKLRHQLEEFITTDMMDELGWEQTDTGTWRKVENEEFWKRLQERGKGFE